MHLTLQENFKIYMAFPSNYLQMLKIRLHNINNEQFSQQFDKKSKQKGKT